MLSDRFAKMLNTVLNGKIECLSYFFDQLAAHPHYACVDFWTSSINLDIPSRIATKIW
jgi:hypothetical protein